MLKDIFINGYVLFAQDANKTVNALEMIPFAGRKISEAGTKTRNILGCIFRLIWEIIKKILFVGIVMYAPCRIYKEYMPSGATGFSIENCFVYFTVVLVVFCGSINRSAIFRISREAYASLKELKCDPKNYFRAVILRRSFNELVSFTISFTVFGMSCVKALYLAIVIVAARFAGDTFNILVFRITGKSFETLKMGTVLIALISLFFAYFIPYMRGYVPGAYNLIFDNLWLTILLIAAAFFAYYVWNYSGYHKIAGRVYVAEELKEDYLGREDDNPYPSLSVVENIRSNEHPDYEGIYREFFAANKGYIRRIIRTKLEIIGIVLVIFIVLAVNSQKLLIYKIISYSMLMLPFVIFGLSNSDELCKRLYYQCDRYMFSNINFLKADDRLVNYFLRLKGLMAVDAVPYVALAFVYLIAGIIAGKEGSFVTVAAVCTGIIILGLFFTFFNITRYYMLQPYKGKIGRDNRRLLFGNIIVYILCTLFINIDTTALIFTLGAGAALSIMAILSVTGVWKFAGNTFHNK